MLTLVGLFVLIGKLFFLLTPLISMFWRGVAFKLFNIVRASIRIVKVLLLSAFTPKTPPRRQPDEKAVIPPAKKEAVVPKSLVPLFRVLDTIDSCCLHARGLMQALAGFVKLSPLNVGPTDTVIFFCETEFHMIFAFMYFITCYNVVKDKAKSKVYPILLQYTMILFQLSDLAKNCAWCYFFFMQYCRAVGMADDSNGVNGGFSSSNFLSFGGVATNAFYSGLTASSVAEFQSVMMPLMASASSLFVLSAKQFLLIKSFLGVAVTCMDMYCGFFGVNVVRPIPLSVCQIISAGFYIWITFY